jgi:endonuclease/exonuclease/phosphatase (EEP) superfamily protein YafD
LPLDQIMSKGNLTIHELHAGSTTGSDHLPLITTFSVGR